MNDIDIVGCLSASTKVDLHGLTKEEAKFELLRAMNLVDISTRAVLVVHGYHNGRVLRDFVRKEFEHVLIEKKLAISPSSTIFVLNFKNLSSNSV